MAPHHTRTLVDPQMVSELITNPDGMPNTFSINLRELVPTISERRALARLIRSGLRGIVESVDSKCHGGDTTIWVVCDFGKLSGDRKQTARRQVRQIIAEQVASKVRPTRI